MSLPGAEVVRLDDALEDALVRHDRFHRTEDRRARRYGQVETADTSHDVDQQTFNRTRCEAWLVFRLGWKNVTEGVDDADAGWTRSYPSEGRACG